MIDMKETTAPEAPKAPKAPSLAALAQASAGIKPEGKLSAERASAASAIGAGLVEGLVEQATLAAKRTLSPDVSQVWAEILETLDGAGLSPIMSCAKTGREIYTLTPDHFPAHLAELSKLGDSPQADAIHIQLIRAIETQKAYNALPSAATTSAGGMAFLRDSSPLDYALVALQDAFPAPKNAQSGELAQRAEQIRLARVNLEVLEPAALAYLCECLHLFLSNIKPSSIAQNCAENTLTHYQGQGFAYITETPAQIGHLCRRIIQLAFNLIAKHKPKRLDRLTTQDILHLRVHYQGLPQYKAQQADRRVSDTVKAMEAKKRAAKLKAEKVSPLFTEKMRGILAAQADAALNEGLEGAVLDMVAALNTGLDQHVKVAASDPAQAAKYHAIFDAAQEPAPDDLSALFGADFGDVDFDLMPEINEEADLIAHGFAIEGELDLFIEAAEEPTEPTDPALDLSPNFATPVSLAMESAKFMPARDALTARDARDARDALTAQGQGGQGGQRPEGPEGPEGQGHKGPIVPKTPEAPKFRRFAVVKPLTIK